MGLYRPAEVAQPKRDRTFVNRLGTIARSIGFGASYGQVIFSLRARRALDETTRYATENTVKLEHPKPKVGGVFCLLTKALLK